MSDTLLPLERTADAELEKIATWLVLFIGTGLDVGIQPHQMIAALKPKKLGKIIEALV